MSDRTHLLNFGKRYLCVYLDRDWNKFVSETTVVGKASYLGGGHEKENKDLKMCKEEPKGDTLRTTVSALSLKRKRQDEEVEGEDYELNGLDERWLTRSHERLDECVD